MINRGCHRDCGRSRLTTCGCNRRCRGQRDRFRGCNRYRICNCGGIGIRIGGRMGPRQGNGLCHRGATNRRHRYCETWTDRGGGKSNDIIGDGKNGTACIIHNRHWIRKGDCHARVLRYANRMKGRRGKVNIFPVILCATPR